MDSAQASSSASDATPAPSGEAQEAAAPETSSSPSAAPEASGAAVPRAVAILSTRIDTNANAGNSSPLISRSQGEPGCMNCECLPWVSHPFFDAAAEGDRAEVAAQLQRDIRLVKATLGGRRYTAWHIAAEKGHVGVLEELLAAVINCKDAVEQLNNSLRRMLSMARTGERLARYFLNCKARGDATPLIVAARAGQTAAVTYLLAVGANAWICDDNGLTALHVAAIHNRNEVIHEFCRQPIPFSRRSYPSNLSNTKYVDVKDPFGWTPLHHACLAGQLDAIKTLLSHEADLVARTEVHNLKLDLLPTGLTPLHLAAYKGNLPMAKILLRAYYEESADLVPSQTALLSTGERRRRQRSHPDPRLLLTRTARLPYHFAHRLSHRHMLEWLDPSIPLMFLFAGTGVEDDAGEGDGIRIGVARLTVLAATALHQHLMSQLEAAEKQLEEAHSQLAEGNLSDIQETGKPATNLGSTVKSLLLNTLNLNRTRQPGSSAGGAPLTSRASGVAQPQTESGLATAGVAAAAAPAPSHAPSPLRPRRHSNPTSGGGASSSARERAERDVLYVGEQAGLMLRLRQGVKMGRARAGQHQVSQQALHRMGIAIPDNIDSEPVAQLRLGQGSSTVPRSLASTWHPNHHNALSHGPAQDDVLSRQSAGERVGSAERRGRQLSLVARASEPGMATRARSAAVLHGRGVEDVATPSALGTHFLTAEPPTPHPDEFAEHPFLLSAEEKISVASTWPLARNLSKEESKQGVQPGAQGGDEDPLLSRISEKTEQTAGASLVSSPQAHQEAAWAISTLQGASDSEEVVAAPSERGPAPGGGGRRGLFTRGNQVHPEPSCSAQVSEGDNGNAGEGTQRGGSGEQDGLIKTQKKQPTVQHTDDDEEDVCPVCLDELPNIVVTKCKHKLCMGCARDLIQRHKLTPALCPYCRVIIPGLVLCKPA